MKIGFLFNHDALHQVAHTVPIAAELERDGHDVRVLTSSAEQEAKVRALLPASSRVRYVSLSAGPLAHIADALLRPVSPFRRLAVLRRNVRLFATLDALVVPDTTSAFLKGIFGLNNLTMIYLPHGAGDRSVGFRPVTRQFDLVLLSGRKVRDRMLAEGLVTPESSVIVGYPKFETVDEQVPRFFDNDRPTVLYNPHFDPLLSSWYEMGTEVLDWFAAQDRFNLIFAPHVMLFKRRVHASVEHRTVRFRRDLAKRFEGLPHMRIDTGSAFSVDMSYTRAADIYLGDVSSQIYEWIMRPRPCLFLNSHRAPWRGNPNYAHWTLGEVMDAVSQLPSALERATADPHRFEAQQASAFEQTFSRTTTPSARRAADAIEAFLRDKSGLRRGARLAPQSDLPQG